MCLSSLSSLLLHLRRSGRQLDRFASFANCIAGLFPPGAFFTVCNLAAKVRLTKVGPCAGSSSQKLDASARYASAVKICKNVFSAVWQRGSPPGVHF